MNERDDNEKMIKIDIINWVESWNCYEEEDDEVGGGDSATHSLNQTRDNNTDFRSYHNCFQNHNYKL